MGLVYSEIILSNPVISALNPMKVRCLADSGSTHLVVPEYLATALQLKACETRLATTADGLTHLVPYVGPIQVSFGDRSCFVGALVMGNEVLLGAIPMEDMDLIIHPKLLRVMANPESPNVARGHAKAA